MVEMISLGELIMTGGIEAREQAAAARAIADEQRSWLPMIEAWAANLGAEDDLGTQVWLAAEIRRLRRALGMPPPAPSAQAIEHRRQQIRERVRRFRERQQAAQ
jgi:hypothetical protein